MTRQTIPKPRFDLRRVAGGWRVSPVLASLAAMVLVILLYVMTFSNFLVVPRNLDRILVVAALSLIAVGWSLRWPVPVALITTVCFAFSVLAGAPAIIAAVTVAMRRRPWEIIGVGILWVTVATRLFLVGAYHLGYNRYNGWSTQASVLVLLVLVTYSACVVVGWYIGSRAGRIIELQARATALEREHAERVEKAKTAERTRIAREMHDVLAHRISLVAIHSGALAYRTDLTSDQVRTAAATVQESARLALAELREVLGILRDTTVEPGMPDRPQPTMAALDDLLAEAREAGTPVALAVDTATADQLPTLGVSTSRHVYRILQESLTNARKHAPGASVEVTVSGTPGERLELVVSNTATKPSILVPDAAAGLGLVGLAERAALAGGALTAREEPAGDNAMRFTVRAWLPWTI